MASTNDNSTAQAAPLYESAKKIYPREIKGRFASLSSHHFT